MHEKKLVVFVVERFLKMKSCLDTYYVLVVEDKSRNQIIGTATLVVEQKFIRGASCVSCLFM